MRSRFVLPAGFLFLASCQCPVRQAGIVLDAESGKPVSHAIVEMEEIRTQTDNRGYFLIKHESGNCTDREITIGKSGYKPFVLKVEDHKRYTSYRVEDRTKYVVFDEPGYVGNDSSNYRLGQWTGLNSTSFTAFGADSLVFFLIPDG